jgi:uncharacterized protein involved in outer membrane biogenesis
MARPPIRRRGRLVRTIMLAVAGVVVLAVAGIAVFVATFDPNSRKPQIIAAVQAATGRELTIGGRIGLSISLQPTLEVSDVSFSNPPGFSRPQMATLQKLELQLALIPLLSKEIRVAQLVVRKPDLLLETNAKGQSNWDFSPVGVRTGSSVGGPAGGSAGAQAGLPGAPPALLPSASSSSPTGNGGATRPPSIALSSVKIEGGTLAMRDASGHTIALALKELTAREPAPNAPLHLTLDAAYNGAPVSLTADTGPLEGLLAGGAVPWPIKLVATAAGAKLGVDGTVAEPAAGRGLAIALTADVPDLAALSALAGTALPPLKTVAVQLRLADMDGGNGIAVSDLKLTLPNADLAGSLSVQRGVRPLVKANLSAKRIDLDALARAMSAAAPAGPGKPEPPDTRGERSGRVIPDTRLPFSVLRLADSDIQLAVDDLRSAEQDYKSIKLHAVTKDGRLTLDPLTLDVPGGQMDLKATVDAKPATPPVTLTLRAPGLALQALLKALDKPGYASGTLELRADLRGAGDTPQAIAASLDGAVGAAVVKGEIDSKLLGNMMSGLLHKTELTQLAGKAGMSALTCFAMRLDASNGVGTLRALRLDTSTLGMTGVGTLNFGAETLDLHVRPSAGIAGTNITAPVIVEGTFADPSIHPDVVGTMTGNAGTAAKLALGASTGGLALIIGSAVDKKLSGDQCAEALALARFSQPPAASGQSDGSAPPAGQPPAKAANNPANALKKLFQ